jgi:hypothetical protein
MHHQVEEEGNPLFLHLIPTFAGKNGAKEDE